ncbi:uncharacterized protein METZ01_LOCUS57126 [marine metagenome]|uniref:Uncharacterized protein n=1 Tax=marine metagenome TaxID=408172 RepID=A0A381SJM8_9ZZZZ
MSPLTLRGPTDIVSYGNNRVFWSGFAPAL